jgi:iron complex outermembrane recepter protein
LVIVINPPKVNATRVEKNIIDIPASVSHIGKEKIQLATEQIGLDESMSQVPGVFFLNRYNYAQDLRVSIRGFGARSSFGIRGVKIIVDGIPETLPDGQGSIDGVDIGSIYKINVIRGPSSSLYGNASGGAILIETERGSKLPFIELRNTYGDFNLNKQQFKIGGETANLNYLLNISNTSVDGYRENSEFENKQFNGRFEYSLSGKSSIVSTIHHTDQPLANDPGGITAGDVTINPRQARSQNLNFQAGEKVKQTRLGLVYKTQLDKSRAIEVRTYNTNRDFSNKLPFQNGGIVNLDRSFYGGGLKYTEEGNLGKYQNRLLLGIDFDRQDDNRSRYNNLLGVKGTQTFQQNELITSLGAYFQNETKLNDIAELTLGIRHDDVAFDVTDKFLADGDNSGKINLNEFSPMAGISLKANSNTNIYATASKAFETPTTTEFANPSGGGFNQTIKPQKSTSYEIGIKTFNNKYSFEAAIFQTNVKDELTPFEDSEQPGRTFFTNAGSSDRRGLELTSIRRFYDQLEFSTTYTYSDFKFNHFRNAGGEIYDGKRIPGIPKNLLNFNLSWSNESGAYANLDTTFTGEFYADNGNQTKVDSYTVSNLRLGKNFIRNDLDIGFYLGVNNIFNEKYNSNIRINAYGNRYFEPAPKQNIFFGITVNKKFPG